MRKTIRKILPVFAIALFITMSLSKCAIKFDTVNQLAQGSNQIEVRFLDCEKKSDASLILVRTEQETTVVVVDGGLADGRCCQELEQLRKAWLDSAGLENSELKLHVTLVVTHFHKDHVAELVKNLIPNEHLAVDALYICEKSALSDEYTPNESTWRKPVLEAMSIYAPDADIITVPFNTTTEIALPYGTAKLFGPCQDYGTEENCALFASMYYPEESADELKEDMATAVLNSNSLFLKVSTVSASVLFPGDVMKKEIDKKEPLDQMIEQYGEELRSDIVKYPHHGQKRDPAAQIVAEKLMKTGGISVLTGPNGAEQGGKALDEYGAAWVDTSEGEQVFVLTDTEWEHIAGTTQEQAMPEIAHTMNEKSYQKLFSD